MRTIFLKQKSRFYLTVLKVMGVCGVFILFEACYGSPKSAWAPRHEQKNAKTKEVKAPVNTEYAKTSDKTITN
jgi:hypothetical protein